MIEPATFRLQGELLTELAATNKFEIVLMYLLCNIVISNIVMLRLNGGD